MAPDNSCFVEHVLGNGDVERWRFNVSILNKLSRKNMIMSTVGRTSVGDVRSSVQIFQHTAAVAAATATSAAAVA